MSESDSFISEVTEEVQRDKLYGYVRRYGWIAALAIILIVGGAAWNEYRKAIAEAAAEQTGDVLLNALRLDAPEERATALAAVTAEGPAAAIAALTTAAAQQEAGDETAAADTLRGLITAQEMPPIYNDLAAFKLALLPSVADDERRAVLEGLEAPGAPLSLLAQEQLALLDLQAGDDDAAVAQLVAIIEDAGASRGLRERAIGLIVAMGAEEQLEGVFNASQ
ncbi:tetratricopeptide repeat protein [Cognatiyoonia sp.]|uniref:tetratricopeptide repeat protein n=1 Tax=Cognatiyoonia sp. TaxID=2211652 RepID=UPI003F6A3CE7